MADERKTQGDLRTRRDKPLDQPASASAISAANVSSRF